jgi:hypothetical protein
MPKTSAKHAMFGGRMKSVHKTHAPTHSAGMLLIAILGLGLCAVLPSFAGVQGLEDEDNAKLARHKAQMKLASKKGDSKNGAGGDSDKCGSIDVGNVTNNKPGRPVREVTVIVDGPIINANNKCR